MTDPRPKPRHDHLYEAGPYAVCRRCGDEYEDHVASGTVREAVKPKE